MPASDFSILCNFTTSGTSSATAVSDITIGLNVNIGSGSTFITGNFAHTIGGDFENNGTFTASSGNLITFNGIANQLIFGNSTTSFDNMTIDNIYNVSILNDININTILTLNSGNLNVGETTLGINGTINKTFGYIDVNSLSSLSFGGTNALVLNDDLFYSTPVIINLTINRTNGVSLGNQNMTINGLLNLQTGTCDIAANTLTIAGISPTRTSGFLDVDNSAATLIFTNSETIILPASIFLGNVNNLTINGIGGITANSDFTVNGILNLHSQNPSSTKGSLDMQTNTLTMGGDATTIGLGDVTGIVKRATINPEVN